MECYISAARAAHDAYWVVESDDFSWPRFGEGGLVCVMGGCFGKLDVSMAVPTKAVNLSGSGYVDCGPAVWALAGRCGAFTNGSI